MAIQHKSRHISKNSGAGLSEVARAYNVSGRDYLRYADGDTAELFNFSSCYGFADREIWRRLDATLKRLSDEGRRTISLLDAGCGPGTWLQRLVLRARQLGFTEIKAHGIDLSPEMILLAKLGTAQLRDAAVNLTFEVGDITQGLPHQDRSFDICLCLYGVFNHLPATTLGQVAADLCRMTSDTIFITVRTVGSPPTIYIDTLDHAKAFHQDNESDRMELDLSDGQQLAFPSHLFTSNELRGLFAPHLSGTALVGLDLFHSRFARNTHWNPPEIEGQQTFEEQLADLEHHYASDPCFIDRAAHILLIGEC